MNTSALRWAYILTAGAALVCISGFLPWVATAGGVAQGRPATTAAVVLILFGAIPALMAQRVARKRSAATARTFMWVFASLDLVGWLIMCLALVLASGIGLGRFAHPEAGLFSCFFGLITIFVCTIFVHARSASPAITLPGAAPALMPEPSQRV